jgi:hypothetical protein
VDAAEFLDGRADVCRLLKFHDLAAPKPEHVHPSEIHKAIRSLRSFTARPKDHYFVALRKEICRPKVLNVERVQQQSKELADFGNTAPQPGGWQVRGTWRTPGHLRIQQSQNAFEIGASERSVNAADDFEIFLFAHGALPWRRMITG